MKRLFILLPLAVVALSGCANQSVKYSEANKPLAESGAIKWSDYYKGLYETAARSGESGEFLSRANRMILAAQSYEAGAINRDQFEYLRREAAAGQAAEDEASDARRRAAFAAAAAAFNSQPTYQLPQPAARAPVQLAAAPVIPAATATAYFTGQQRQVQTVTYQSGWSCEYRYVNQTFWRTFVGTCPSSVQVQ